MLVVIYIYPPLDILLICRIIKITIPIADITCSGKYLHKPCRSF